MYLDKKFDKKQEEKEGKDEKAAHRHRRLLYGLLGVLVLFTSTLLTIYNVAHLDTASWAAYPFIAVQAVWYFIVFHNATMLLRLAFYEEPRRSHRWAANPPTISVIVPLYREPPSILERFADGLATLTYPADKVEVIVVEDSENPVFEKTVEIFQDAEARKGFRLVLLRRSDRRGYRGGAIKEGINVATGKYIVVFDVDHKPLPDALEKMVSVIEANRYDVVIFPQHFVEAKNVIENASYIGYRFDYVFSRKGKSVTNSAFCVGTNWIGDRKRILSAGGYDDTTIVEDFATSLKLWHPRGLDIGFAEDKVAVGLLPGTLEAWKIQQYRWSYGAFRGFKDYLRSFTKLSFFQRLDYLSTIVWYLVGPISIISSLFPLMSSLGAPFLRILSLRDYAIIVVGFTYLQILLYASPLLIVGEKPVKVSLGQAVGIFVSDTYTLALIDAMRGKKRGFKVTPKGGKKAGILDLARQLAVPLLLVSLNTFVALLYLAEMTTFRLINAFWATYNNSWLVTALLGYSYDLSKNRI